MDDFQITRRYWTTVVILPAIREACNLSKIGDRVMDLVIAVLVAIGYAIYFGVVVQTESIYLAITTLVVALVIFIIPKFIWNVFYLPAKTYKDVGGFSGNPLKLTPRPPERSSSDAWAVMNVTCKSGFGVSECVLTLMDAIDTKTHASILRSPEERLTVSGRSQRHGIQGYPDRPGNLPIGIEGNGTEYWDIAQTVENNQRAKFTLWHNDDQYIPPGEYEITIAVNGRWNKEIPEGFTGESKFILTYNGGNGLSIRVLEMSRTLAATKRI